MKFQAILPISCPENSAVVPSVTMKRRAAAYAWFIASSVRSAAFLKAKQQSITAGWLARLTQDQIPSFKIFEGLKMLQCCCEPTRRLNITDGGIG